jgi:antitoxin MazE
MEVTIRTIGNSKGVVLPKPLLARAGLDGQATASLEVENGAIVLRKPAQTVVRAGWAAAAASVAAKESDTLLMGEFGNVDDTELTW